METRIVVIDNDENMRELVTFCIKDAGWEVLTYAYTRIDLPSLQELHPDLIILAFDRPSGGTGWEFLQLLKMEDATAHIPIVIRTAFRLSGEMRSYLLTRYIQVVGEPFDLDSFILLVRDTLTQANQAGVVLARDRSFPILVVDDTEDLRQVLATVLRLEGYQVVTANNGLLALDAVHSAEHCLILLDITMPIMDGFEFLRTYGQQQRPHTPVVILSGEKDILTRVLPSFVVDVLPKPFEVSHLLRVVAKYVQPA